MKKNKKKTSLSLNKERVRSLVPAVLSTVHGGMPRCGGSLCEQESHIGGGGE
jgi:hypothetical protein